jgi:D-alanyl-D-alanine carboxypeptidase
VVETVTPSGRQSPARSTPEPATPDAPPTASRTSDDPASPTPTPARDTGKLLPCGDILVPIDKQNRVGADCVPPDLVALPAEIAAGQQLLRAEAADAARDMIDAAARDGLRLFVDSGYRSYDYQATLFDSYVRTQGIDYAERTSARPGHSEHQLGTAADIASPGHSLEAFEGTPEAAWVAANASTFGFVVSYPAGKEAITGYAYEPWHVRYVGKDVARQAMQTGKTLREFLLERAR